MATDAGLVERVNLEVMDKGITLKVEDVVADSSRVALSLSRYWIKTGNREIRI